MEELLEQDIYDTVKRYLGYAEDVHLYDFLTIDKSTFEVGYRQNRSDKYDKDEYFICMLDLIQRDGLWFCPDKERISYVVRKKFMNTQNKEKNMTEQELLKQSK